MTSIWVLALEHIYNLLVLYYVGSQLPTLRHHLLIFTFIVFLGVV